eukprot:2049906-Alexandrium_andersonii.AAC.1
MATPNFVGRRARPQTQAPPGPTAPPAPPGLMLPEPAPTRRLRKTRLLGAAQLLQLLPPGSAPAEPGAR